MKLAFTLIALCFHMLHCFGQIGIGTDTVDPSILLQIEDKLNTTEQGGVLFPRIALLAANSIAPIEGTPTTGLMIYNTATSGTAANSVSPGLYYWDNDLKRWSRMTQKNQHAVALFSNQDTKTDINAKKGVYADLFANTRFNYNTALYQKINNTTLQINEVGYYKVILNLDLASSGGADNFGLEVLVNEREDIVSENMYIPGRWNSASAPEKFFPNGRSFTIYIPINTARSTINIKTYQIDPNTDVYFKNPDTSTISIEKIR